MMTSFTIGDVVDIPWRPERPVRVTANMYDAALRLRPALIDTAKRRSTLTYGEAEILIEGRYVAQGLGPLLDLISADCDSCREPSLAALVVRLDTGEVGDSFRGDPGAERERCYEYWSAR
jgi:hypothetical protein